MRIYPTLIFPTNPTFGFRLHSLSLLYWTEKYREHSIPLSSYLPVNNTHLLKWSRRPVTTVPCFWSPQTHWSEKTKNTRVHVEGTTRPIYQITTQESKLCSCHFFRNIQRKVLCSGKNIHQEYTYYLCRLCLSRLCTCII